jgi:hypothetical protein
VLSERGVDGASATLLLGLTDVSALKAVAESIRVLRYVTSLPTREQARFPALIKDIVSVAPVVVGIERRGQAWIDEVRYCNLAGPARSEGKA